MDALPAATKAELIRLGLAGEEEWDDDGKGMKKHLIPLWTVEDKYWWTQTFRPGARSASTIATSPARAGASRASSPFPNIATRPKSRAMIAKYCVDQAFIAAVDKRRNKGLEAR